MSLFWRRHKQLWHSLWLRLRGGPPQPTRAEIKEGKRRVEVGCAGAVDGGIVQRDHCLARGYCCTCGCRYCPWGFDAKTKRFIGSAGTQSPHADDKS